MRIGVAAMVGVSTLTLCCCLHSGRDATDPFRAYHPEFVNDKLSAFLVGRVPPQRTSAYEGTHTKACAFGVQTYRFSRLTHTRTPNSRQGRALSQGGRIESVGDQLVVLHSDIDSTVALSRRIALRRVQLRLARHAHVCVNPHGTLLASISMDRVSR